MLVKNNETLSRRFMKIAYAVRNKQGENDFWFRLRIMFLESLLQGGIPLTYLPETSTNIDSVIYKYVKGLHSNTATPKTTNTLKPDGKTLLHGTYNNFMLERWDHGTNTHPETYQMLDFLAICCSSKTNSENIKGFLNALNEQNMVSGYDQENYHERKNNFDINMMNHFVSTVMCIVDMVHHTTSVLVYDTIRFKHVRWMRLVF